MLHCVDSVTKMCNTFVTTCRTDIKYPSVMKVSWNRFLIQTCPLSCQHFPFCLRSSRTQRCFLSWLPQSDCWCARPVASCSPFDSSLCLKPLLNLGKAIVSFIRVVSLNITLNTFCPFHQITSPAQASRCTTLERRTATTERASMVMVSCSVLFYLNMIEPFKPDPTFPFGF